MKYLIKSHTMTVWSISLDISKPADAICSNLGREKSDRYPDVIVVPVKFARRRSRSRYENLLSCDIGCRIFSIFVLLSLREYSGLAEHRLRFELGLINFCILSKINLITLKQKKIRGRCKFKFENSRRVREFFFYIFTLFLVEKRFSITTHELQL